MEWDGYFYKGITVLKNKEGIKDQDQLDIFEKQATLHRAKQLEKIPIKSNFDSEHLKAIHKHLFQDVYKWAGQNREVDIGKNTSEFERVDNIDSSLNQTFTELSKKDNLKGLNHADFIDEFSKVYSDLNKAHPFREGNGRTLQLLMQDLAKEAGYSVDYKMVSKDDWNRTFEYDMYDNNDENLKKRNGLKDHTELEELFATITKPLERTPEEKILTGSLEELFQDDSEQLKRIALHLMIADKSMQNKSQEFKTVVNETLRKDFLDKFQKGEEIPLPNLKKEQEQDRLER